MGVPLAGDFDLAVPKPIDSRLVWNGTPDTLNNVPNKFPGLHCYVSSDQNLYVYQGNLIWEKIVTNNVDSTTFVSNFIFDHNQNGQVLYVNSENQVTASLNGSLSDFPVGYNVTIIQENIGNVVITSPNFNIVSRINVTKTAGRYAVASLLRIRNTSAFVLYGDLI
jgi:hypothetical protein